MFVSTRSGLKVSDIEAVLQGIAPDGGLFTDPDIIGGVSFDVRSCMGLSYTGLAEKVIGFLLPGFAGEIPEIVSVYPEKFSDKQITPVSRVGEDYVLELYHGPTSAFKDVALSVLPHFIKEAKKKAGICDRISILTATSGDTGKAALEGFHDVEGTDITVFFPDGGVSAMQKAQMVTQSGTNVRVCAVRGNFDDCQRGVKKAFAEFARTGNGNGRRLSSANSINIGRLVPQVVYYFSAYSQLVGSGKIIYGDKVDYIVPTGNFGDILAGYIAKQIGLPVGRLVCAANSNNVLADFISSGIYDRRRAFIKTASPSMDILVSSNLERMLFYASDGDYTLVSRLMSELSSDGVYTLDGTPFERIRKVFSTGYADETETSETIGRLWRDCHWLSDTHTAVAFAVMEKYKKSSDYTGNRCVVLSTASPFKFPKAVLNSVCEAVVEDDFEAADRLSDYSGIEIPENLNGLRNKKVLHTDIIEINDVVSYAIG